MSQGLKVSDSETVDFRSPKRNDNIHNTISKTKSLLNGWIKSVDFQIYYGEVKIKEAGRCSREE